MARESLLNQYNAIAHGDFSLFWRFCRTADSFNCQASCTGRTTKTTKTLAIRHHRLHQTTSSRAIVLTIYAVLMVQESSWFYKEILTWYDDIFSDQLLNNFSLREKLINETMGRNDFRFYPLSHQDLHALSWVTPYIKVWSLASAR